ncbi:MAG: hypothetical protein GY895_21250 [Phycisphaera sp.]|nr:hypothetical protein [Phycisphaera sp.]
MVVDADGNSQPVEIRVETPAEIGEMLANDDRWLDEHPRSWQMNRVRFVGERRAKIEEADGTGQDMPEVRGKLLGGQLIRRVGEKAVLRQSEARNKAPDLPEARRTLRFRINDEYQLAEIR